MKATIWFRSLFAQVSLTMTVFRQDIAFAIVGVVMPVAMGSMPLLRASTTADPSGYDAVAQQVLLASGISTPLIWICYTLVNSVARRRDNLLYKRLRTTPVPKNAILLGEALFASLMALCQSLVVFCIGVFYFHVPAPHHVSLVIAALILGSLLMSVLTLGVSGILPSGEISTWIVTPFVVAMWLGAGSFSANGTAHESLWANMAQYLPSTPIFQAIRTGYLGQDAGSVEFPFGPELGLWECLRTLDMETGVWILWMGIGWALFDKVFRWDPRAPRSLHRQRVVSPVS